MGIIYMMTVMAYITNPNLFLVMFARVVRWNIKYGVCKYSPHAFGTYGVVLCGVFGDFKGSYQLGMYCATFG
jgi:predicted ATPase